eukprot:CAMPEP_0170557048 /NCGR_PEP_ID=MMETSP0211-20121228/19160_1 /TAXON_ID=311385 /ORGANISM="Pseudokeronopsis sp., Strain OXSARD2" /LENGTH=50 /DNA_ID=CAMNT_0010867741 /DNA_START=142 /DNA_END=294 /DNA_ORIENTATION=+
MKLCDAPTEYNFFETKMRTNQNIMELKQKIVEAHGRVDNIRIYDKDAKVL